MMNGIQKEVRKIEKHIDSIEETIFNAYNALQSGHTEVAMEQLFKALPAYHQKTQGAPNGRALTVDELIAQDGGDR